MIAVLFRVGLTIGLAAVAAADTPAGDPPKDKAMTITRKPLTVKVETTPELRDALAATAKPGQKAAIRLTLGGVVPPEQRSRVEGVRVFLNRGANAATPTDDPHFVTAFTFPPTTDRNALEFNLDLTRTVGELARRGELDPAQPLRITLVAIPAPSAGELPAGFSVPVRQVAVTADPVR